MEHFTKITFWMVTLICIQARFIPVQEAQIPSIKGQVKCPSDSEFYTPKNVEKRCITTALDCVRTELNGTVREECTDNNEDIDWVAGFITAAIKELKSEGFAMASSSECTCEKWSPEPLEKFLDGLESLLNFANDAMRKKDPSAG